VCSYTLLQSMTVPALPHIQAELHASQSSASWILTSFLISASVATPILGRLGDAHGKIRMLVISLGLLSLGALGAALATTLAQMVAARAVQGFAGGVLPLAFGIIRDELPARRVPGAVALLSSLMSVGFGAGIVIAGPVVELVGYRALFLLPTVAGVTAAATIAWLVRESPVRTGRQVRILPAVALAGWLVAALLAVSGAPRAGWTSPRTLGLLAAAVVLLGMWVLIESRIDVPLIDLGLLVDRRVAGANVVALLIGISMYASFGFLPQLTQTPAASGYGLGASVALSGYLTLPTAVMSFIGGLSSSRLGERLGRPALITMGCCLSSVGLLSISLAHDHVWQFLVANSLTGLGSGFVFAALANVVVAAAPVGSTSVAAGLNANLRTIGGSIGSAVMASIVTHHLLPAGWPAESGYTVGFALLAATSLTAGVVASRMPRRGDLAAGVRRLDKTPIRLRNLGDAGQATPALVVRTSE
jgi:MFS family permease